VHGGERTGRPIEEGAMAFREHEPSSLTSWAGRWWVVVVAAVGLGLGVARDGRAQSTVSTPDPIGDQLIFFFDARSGRVPFLNVSNPASTSVVVEVAFYGNGLAARLGATTLTLPGFGSKVIDPTSSDFGGVGTGNAGLAIVTPIKSTSNSQPVVPPLPLVGN